MTVIRQSSSISTLDDDFSSSGLSSLDDDGSLTIIGESHPFKCMFAKESKIKNGQRVSVILLNILAVKAKCLFEDTTSISALESNGKMHTFIVAFEQYPKALVIDLRKETVMADGNVSLMRKSNATTLEEVAGGK